MTKIGFVSSEKPDAIKSLKMMEQTYDSVPPEKADIIVALGGDGTMLKSLHDFLHLNKPIYGMNKGHIGFLMNQFSEKNLKKRLDEAIPYKLSPLKIKCFEKNKKIKESLAFNDVSLIRSSSKIAKIKIEVNNKTRIEEFLGDGCLIATPAGSSAYNLSLRGPVIPVGAKVLALTPISPYRPRRWRGALIKNNSIIEFNVINPKMRPVSASADAFEVKNISKVSISQKNDINLRILYDKKNSMEDKYLREQFSIG